MEGGEGGGGARGLGICTTNQQAVSWGNNSSEGNWDGGERQHSELRGSVMLRKKQCKEVTKGWGKDGNKETRGEWSGMAVSGISLFSSQGIQHTMPALPVVYRLQHCSRLQNNRNNGV